MKPEKKKRYITDSLIVMAVGITALVSLSCTSNFVHLAQQHQMYATHLRERCHSQVNDVQKLAVADSLYRQANTLYEKGKHEHAYLALDEAVIRYRLVLLQREYARVTGRLDARKGETLKLKKRLDTYRDIADQLAQQAQHTPQDDSLPQ